MKWYFEVFKKYAVFDGRARRSEFWYFVLFNSLIFTLAVVLDCILSFFLFKEVLFFLTGIYFIASVIPCYAVAVRRLHDIGRSGWWCLLSNVPLIGIVVLVFWAKDSTPGVNKYGPNPKDAIPPPFQTGMKYCGKCGALLKYATGFCSKCGAPI